MDRIDYLKEKKYKMQGQLNSLYSNNGDIKRICDNGYKVLCLL